MYFIIEHSGTEEHTNAAKKLAEYLEMELNSTTELVVGYNPDIIIVYNEDLKKVLEITPRDINNKNTLEMCVHLSISEQED